jgi:hypothetical protein
MSAPAYWRIYNEWRELEVVKLDYYYVPGKNINNHQHRPPRLPLTVAQLSLSAHRQSDTQSDTSPRRQIVKMIRSESGQPFPQRAERSPPPPVAQTAIAATPPMNRAAFASIDHIRVKSNATSLPLSTTHLRAFPNSTVFSTLTGDSYGG